MPRETAIIATSRNRENIPSIKGDANKIGELENEILPSNVEYKVKESLENEDTLGLIEDTEPIDNDLGITGNIKLDVNIETQRGAKEINFDDTNLLLG